MNREQAESMLALLVFDDLEEPMRSELLEYLKTDAELNERLGDMRLTAKLLRDAVGEKEAPRLDDAHRVALKKDIERDKRKRGVIRFQLGTPMHPAIAALLVISTVAILVGILLPSLGASRKSSLSAQATSQARGIGQGMELYARDNDGRYPERVSELVEDGYISPDYVIAPDADVDLPSNFAKLSQTEQNDWIDGNSSYRLLARGEKSEGLDSKRIVGYMEHGDGKGVSVTRSDGSASYERKNELPELIEGQLTVNSGSTLHYQGRTPVTAGTTSDWYAGGSIAMADAESTPAGETDDFALQQSRVDMARQKLAMKSDTAVVNGRDWSGSAGRGDGSASFESGLVKDGKLDFDVTDEALGVNESARRRERFDQGAALYGKQTAQDHNGNFAADFGTLYDDYDGGGYGGGQYRGYAGDADVTANADMPVVSMDAIELSKSTTDASGVADLYNYGDSFGAAKLAKRPDMLAYRQTAEAPVEGVVGKPIQNNEWAVKQAQADESRRQLQHAQQITNGPVDARALDTYFMDGVNTAASGEVSGGTTLALRAGDGVTDSLSGGIVLNQPDNGVVRELRDVARDTDYYGSEFFEKDVRRSRRSSGVVVFGDDAAPQSQTAPVATPEPTTAPVNRFSSVTVEGAEATHESELSSVTPRLETLDQVELGERWDRTHTHAADAKQQGEQEVQSLLRQALDLQREQRYEEMLDVLDQADVLDPNDVAVDALREMFDESKIYVQARDIHRRVQLGDRDQVTTNDQSTIPYDEVATYPADWPQLSLGRPNRGVDGEVDELAELEEVKKRIDDLTIVQQQQAGREVALGTTVEKLEKVREEAEQAQQASLVAGFVMPAEEAAPARKPRLMPVNPWVMTDDDRLSTFALDVDTASYDIARRYINNGFLPPKHTVRMEEFVNNFDYNYPAQQAGSEAFGVYAEAGPSPFGQGTVLMKVGVRGKVIGRDQAKPANLVFVVDTSGSMAREDRLPLVRKSLGMVLDQLSEQDRVSVVSYGTEANLLIEAEPAENKQQILDTLENLQTGGSTNLLGGVELGYEVAQRQFITNGVNRVILNSDGVANVGPSEADELVEQAQTLRRQGVSFTSVGFGAGNYDDRILEQLANTGDGDYLFVGSIDEAKRVFVDNMAASRPTIAYDAKIQVDFDPERVRRYRLIGYENRDIADSDFRNDAVDAGEVGSGQSATALYELELHGPVFALGDEPDLGTVYVRYRDPETGQVRELESRLTNDQIKPMDPVEHPRFFLAAGAARFAEVLRGSEHVSDPDVNSNLVQVQRIVDIAASQLPMDKMAQELPVLVTRAQGLPRGE